MPAQLSTILYITNCKEKTSSGYFVTNAIGYTRLDEKDLTQKFNITAFYPIDETKPCYLPRLSEGQVLSISNAKFSRSTNTCNELDLILTSGSILNIAPEELPIHQITVVGITTATDAAQKSELGVQVECTISDYLTRDKLVELPITLFHPTGSRFTNQTMSIKRHSSIFFSGALSLIEDKIYIELQNFSFVRNSQTSTGQMPWSKTTSQTPWSKTSQTPDNFTPTSSANIARSIHNSNKKSTLENPVLASATLVESSKKSDKDDKSDEDNLIIVDKKPTIKKSPITPKKRKNLPPPTPTSTKRRTRSMKTAKNLADIASNVISLADSEPENIEDDEF